MIRILKNVEKMQYFRGKLFIKIRISRIVPHQNKIAMF